MPRAATTHDAFNAIAEPKRRRLIEVLAGRRMTVTEIVVEVGWPQPMVSKHLGVLRQVGLVRSERRGQREQVYELDAQPLRDVHAWAAHFERFWDTHLSRIKQRAERAAQQQKESGS